MKKIVVVDDEHDVQFLFEQRFRKELKSGEIEFHFAFSGESALEYLDHEDPSTIEVVLSDINMPGMSGLDLLKIAKEKYANLKIVMITAYNDSTNYQMAVQYGSDDYFTKPIDFTILKNKLLNR
ncbi:MAG: response regulator [Ignavibacteria bacterium]|nr:response regulator [Ignavibacteria bacterium]